MSTPTAAAPQVATAPKSQEIKIQKPGAARLVSLDVFRGLTIASMILVNNAGDWKHVYWPLEHAEWHGWTPTDLIFPFFLFIVGVSMAFSFANRVAKGATRGRLMAHAAKRAAIIFAIGLFLAGAGYAVSFSQLRYPGVLQRIAVCYLIASVFALFSGRRTWLITTAVLLIGYWATMNYVPVPGHGRVPIQLVSSEDQVKAQQNDNLAAYIDRKVVPGTLYQKTWDPEGILSTFPAIGTALVGLLVGDWMRRQQGGMRLVRTLALVGVALMIVGRALHPIAPINKNLWTSTFVLFTAGFAMLLLALSYWAIDIKKWRGPAATFCLVFGMNSILVYALSSFMGHLSFMIHVNDAGKQITAKAWVYAHSFAHVSNPYMGSMLYGLTYVALWWAIMYVLYKRQIFVKV